MDLKSKIVLITGANRGIGAELVKAFLKHDVEKVYAAARNLSSLPDFNDPRVVPLKLDITDKGDVAAAINKVVQIDILVNNAGVMTYNNVVTSSIEALAADMDVNYYGTLRVTQAFTPLIEKRGGGAIVNLNSIVSYAPPLGITAYSASKAALFSATQAQRAILKSKNIEVIGVYPGPIDTDLAKDLPLEKASVVETAENIVKGLAEGQEDIYPDPTSSKLAQLWGTNPKGLEQFFANM